MIIMAESRDLSMKEVLSHPLGPLPWALATPDGLLRKTNKAILGHELQKHGTSVETFTVPSACVIDGMGIVQRIKGDQTTFGQIAE